MEGVLGTTSVGMLYVSSFSADVVATFLPFIFSLIFCFFIGALETSTSSLGTSLFFLAFLGFFCTNSLTLGSSRVSSTGTKFRSSSSSPLPGAEGVPSTSPSSSGSLSTMLSSSFGHRTLCAQRLLFCKKIPQCPWNSSPPGNQSQDQGYTPAWAQLCHWIEREIGVTSAASDYWDSVLRTSEDLHPKIVAWPPQATQQPFALSSHWT